MARLLLIDETAGAERFSSTESQNANIGTGVGSGRLTLDVTIFLNLHASVAPGRCVPPSVNPSSGSVSAALDFGTGVVTTAVSSRFPICCVDGGPNSTFFNGFSCVTTDGNPSFFISDMANGSFTVENLNGSICGGGTSTNYYYI